MRQPSIVTIDDDGDLDGCMPEAGTSLLMGYVGSWMCGVRASTEDQGRHMKIYSCRDGRLVPTYRASGSVISSFGY